jgi:hypothetical protein
MGEAPLYKAAVFAAMQVSLAHEEFLMREVSL